MCWWTGNSRGQIQLAFNSCFSLKRPSFKQAQFVMNINFRAELLSVWERLTPTSWGGNVEGTLTTSRNSLLPSYVMYICSPLDNQCHACQQYIKQSNPFFTLPLRDWSPTSFCCLRIQQSACSLYHECVLCFCVRVLMRISKHFMYAHDSVDSIVFPGSKNKLKNINPLIWRSVCQRTLWAVLIKTASTNSEIQSERCAAPASLRCELLVVTNSDVASLPVLCTKLPLLAVAYQSGFPHVIVGLHLSAQVTFLHVLALSPYLPLRAVSELTL